MFYSFDWKSLVTSSYFQTDQLQSYFSRFKLFHFKFILTAWGSALSHIRNFWTRLDDSNPNFAGVIIFVLWTIYTKAAWSSLKIHHKTFMDNIYTELYYDNIFSRSEWIPCDKDVTFVLAPNRISFFIRLAACLLPCEIFQKSIRGISRYLKGSRFIN